MGYFQVRYDSRVIIYDRRAFIRLATENVVFDISDQVNNLKVKTLFDGGAGALVLWLWGETSILKIVGSNPSTIYLDMFHIVFLNCNARFKQTKRRGRRWPI